MNRLATLLRVGLADGGPRAMPRVRASVLDGRYPARVSLKKLGALLTLVVLLVSLAGSAAQAQADRSLRIVPGPIQLAPGERVEVAAWFCRRLPSGDFGADEVPGTDDDRCEQVARVIWSTEHPRIARIQPDRDGLARLIGGKEGLTTLTASYEASATSSFVSRVPVDVLAPLPEDLLADDTEAEPPDAGPDDDSADAAPGDAAPAVSVTAAVHPGLAIVAPGDSQVFVAFLCLILEGADPRGVDLIPGTADDLCRPTAAAWQLLGEPPVGTLDPLDGIFTVLTTDDQDDETGFVAMGLSGPRTAVSDDQSTPRTGGLMADVAGHPATVGVTVDSSAPQRTGIPGDVDGDGDVDLADVERVIDAFGSIDGDPDFDPDADFDGHGEVSWFDLFVVLAFL